MLIVIDMLTLHILFSISVAGQLDIGVSNDPCNWTNGAAVCEDMCLEEYVKCIETCQGDSSCMSNCNRDSVNCEGNCPIATGCAVTFLVVNTNQAALFTWEVGTENRVETLQTFTDFFDFGSSADTSCSFVYKGKMYIIGGNANSHQISVLRGCTLTPSGTLLPITMEDPICSTYNNGDDVMLYDGEAVLTAWRFNGSNVEVVANPEHWHDEGAMTHWNNDPIIIGGVGYETERFNGVFWEQEENLPTSDLGNAFYIEYHSAVNFMGDVYLFGGNDLYHGTGAFKFNGSWSRLEQNLAGFRYGHRSIVHGDNIYHIGGNRNQDIRTTFEEWSYNREYDNFTITVSETELFNYYVYPETFIVDAADYAACNFTLAMN